MKSTRPNLSLFLLTLIAVGAVWGADACVASIDLLPGGMGWAILGLVVWLVLAFPRPLMGVPALAPAAVGTAAGFLISALFHQDVSGSVSEGNFAAFGGAILSITAVYGVIPLLFFDQPREIWGKQAFAEAKGFGLTAAMISFLTFGLLGLTGVPMLSQVGRFAAGAVAFSFLFARFFFPKFFPEPEPVNMPESSPPSSNAVPITVHPRPLPLYRALVNFPLPGKSAALVAMVFAGIMLFFIDVDLFKAAASDSIFSGLVYPLAIVGGCATLLVFFFFLDPRLTAIVLTPAVFALAGTLGTLSLMGQASDTTVLLTAVVIFGPGIHGALFLVRAYQRYGDPMSTDFGRIKAAVILSAGAGAVGFGGLCFSDQALLVGAGWVGLLGIGYAVIGTFLLVPTLLVLYFRPNGSKTAHSPADPRRRILDRYKFVEPYPRIFARFKLQTDVMFSELVDCLAGQDQVRTVLDIGCGYGVPGAWVLEHFPEARIYGIDPDPQRIRVADRVYAERGQARCDLAPHIPQAPGPADAAFMLDMSHYLDDAALDLTLQRLRAALDPKARLVIRALIPRPDNNYSKTWQVEVLKMKIAHVPTYHRSVADLSTALVQAGYEVRRTTVSGDNPESAWLIATPLPHAPNGTATSNPVGKHDV